MRTPPDEEANRPRRIRYDIEGLRALAVLSVLINHAFPRWLPGGFVGVDIFFVISGYLIGRHLLQDINAGRLSIMGFYAKRARRIFPALAIVLICVWGAGWVFLRLLSSLPWPDIWWLQSFSQTISCFGRKVGTSTRLRSTNLYCTYGHSALRNSSIFSFLRCYGWAQGARRRRLAGWRG